MTLLATIGTSDISTRLRAPESRPSGKVYPGSLPALADLPHHCGHAVHARTGLGLQHRRVALLPSREEEPAQEHAPSSRGGPVALCEEAAVGLWVPDGTKGVWAMYSEHDQSTRSPSTLMVFCMAV